MKLMKRKLLITCSALVILAGLVAGCSVNAQPAANPLPPATAPVTRTTLVETRSVPGALGYGEPVPVSLPGTTGTLTWVAPVGATVARGEPLFKVDEQPVVALYGAVPMYRTLEAGMEGADVQQLEENLAELGYTGYTYVTIDVLSNDRGAGLQVSAVTNPANGTAVINTDNSITYTPNPGFAGVDTFSYTAADANDLSDTALLTVVVIPVSPPASPEGPTASPDVATTSQDRRVTVEVLANDQGDDLQVSDVDNPTNGTAVINGGNTINYTPAPGFTGVDTFSYTATGANGLSDTALVTVVVSPSPPTPPASGPAVHADVTTTLQDTPDTFFTSATAEAVRAWQADLGLPETGTVELGQVVFTPGAVRIAGHTARLGDTIGGAPVLSYTGLDRLVTVQLSVTDRSLAVEGQAVTVTVPGVGAVEGEISMVSTVLTDQGGTGAAPGSTSSAASDMRVEVTVTIAGQEALGSLDAAPVEVDFASQERADVLAVPVAALLALPEGGYGVEVVEGDTTRIVPVRTGMFAAGRVEVSGEGIAEGVTVGVPR